METPNVFYVDKSHFIPKLEAYGDALILLAPRRFGKSIFLDMLANYYDKNINNTQFQKLFGNLHIGKHPTELRGKFHVLKLDFSEGLDTASVAAFQQSLHVLINDAVQVFRDLNPDFPAIKSSDNGIVTFRRVLAKARTERLSVRGLSSLHNLVQAQANLLFFFFY